MTWRVLLRLGRVSNLPTVWTNVLAGVVLAGVPIEGRALAILTLAMSLFYIGGMYLNDAFDRDIDARERPERPIPSGLISPQAVFASGFGLLAAAMVILLAQTSSRAQPGRGAAVLSGLVLAATIVYYDARHKGNPWSPAVMGLCRVLVYVTAALAVAGRVDARVLAGAVVLLCYLIGLTYIAKQETLTEFQNLWPLAFLGAPFVYGLPVLVGAGAPGAALYLGFLAWVAWAISLLVRRGRADIPRAVVALIAGISLLDAVLIAGTGRWPAALWGVAGFGLTLALQRFVRGT